MSVCHWPLGKNFCFRDVICKAMGMSQAPNSKCQMCNRRGPWTWEKSAHELRVLWRQENNVYHSLAICDIFHAGDTPFFRSWPCLFVAGSTHWPRLKHWGQPLFHLQARPVAWWGKGSLDWIRFHLLLKKSTRGIAPQQFLYVPDLFHNLLHEING